MVERLDDGVRRLEMASDVGHGSESEEMRQELAKVADVLNVLLDSHRDIGWNCLNKFDDVFHELAYVFETVLVTPFWTFDG